MVVIFTHIKKSQKESPVSVQCDNLCFPMMMMTRWWGGHTDNSDSVNFLNVADFIHLQEGKKSHQLESEVVDTILFLLYFYAGLYGEDPQVLASGGRGSKR